MSIFPAKILLATDGSEEANLAIRTAVDLADKTELFRLPSVAALVVGDSEQFLLEDAVEALRLIH